MHRLWSDLGPIKKYCSPQFGFLIIFLLMGSSSLPRRFCWFLFWIVASSSQRVAEIKKFVVLRGRIGIVSYFLSQIRSCSYDQSLAFQQDLVPVMNSLFGYCPPPHPPIFCHKKSNYLLRHVVTWANFIKSSLVIFPFSSASLPSTLGSISTWDKYLGGLLKLDLIYWAPKLVHGPTW